MDHLYKFSMGFHTNQYEYRSTFQFWLCSLFGFLLLIQLTNIHLKHFNTRTRRVKHLLEIIVRILINNTILLKQLVFRIVFVQFISKNLVRKFGKDNLVEVGLSECNASVNFGGITFGKFLIIKLLIANPFAKNGALSLKMKF